MHRNKMAPSFNDVVGVTNAPSFPFLRQKARAGGLYEYVPKPYRPHQLLAKMTLRVRFVRSKCGGFLGEMQ
jgi:hypothetical protein